MWTNTGYVMTLANSIIGVGILAMPFCFQKCGILLAIFLLILSNWLTRICCHYLIKSSLLTRRKSFEFLGFHAFGPSGKLLVELCIIGYLLGTCITYFVVVGDLGPQIVTKMFDIQHDLTTRHLRTWLMSAVTIFCILPLAMLKNVDSLSIVCTASIGFYICLVVKIILESQTHVMAHDWQDAVVYWQPHGILQCLPIFSMALSCQMQIFEVFNSINNQSLEKLNGIVCNATWMCTLVYISMGFFGYVAFCTQIFSGNILMNLTPSFGSDVIKVGFVLSVAFSFPLVIFPCRASLYSLLYRKGQADVAGCYIPERRFKIITLFIVIFSLSIALMIPSVELIIGLVGSTIGVAICIMFPAACFRKIVQKDSTERNLAQVIIIGGFCLMILGTYANLSAIDAKSSGAHLEKSSKQLNRNDIIEQQQQELDNNNYQLENILKQPSADINNQVHLSGNVKIQKLKDENDDEAKAKEKQLQQLQRLSEVNTSGAAVSSQSISPPPAQKPLLHQPQLLPTDILHKDDDGKVKASPLSSSPPPLLLHVPHTDQIIKVNEDNLPQPINKESLISKQHDANANDIGRQIDIDKKFDKQIDNEAIKKEEAEIYQGGDKMKQYQNIEELEKTQNELKKTKEIFEKRVKELKVELAKQNQETQNLVEEKLGKVVEKFEQIERKVEQQQRQQKQPSNLKQAISKKYNASNYSYKMMPKIQEFNDKHNDNLLEYSAYNNIKQLDLEKLNEDIHSTEIKNEMNKISIETNSSKNNIQQSKPLPLALLINNTIASNTNNNISHEISNTRSAFASPPPSPLKDVKDVSAKVNDIKQQIVIDDSNKKNHNNDNNYTNINIMDKQNVDTIRRDLLQLNVDNQIGITAKWYDNKSENDINENTNQRMKRSPPTNSNKITNEKTENDHGHVAAHDIKKRQNCLKTSQSQRDLLDNNQNVNVNMKYRRDLKYIQIDNR